MGQQHHPRRSVAVIVDDDAGQRFLSGTLFEEADFEVVECATADEAWELIQNRRDDVQLLFTDVYLPGRMDGFELARKVHDALPGVPVIVTSGAAGHRLDELPPHAEFLPKPWRPFDLLMRAERVRA
jgi:DNA-binding NtrC family response regulator